MGEILMQAFSFVAIIILGYVLRSRGFFKEEDFYVISRIVLKITLPAAIVSNFSGMSLEPSMLLISLLGLGGWCDPDWDCMVDQCGEVKGRACIFYFKYEWV